MYSFLITAAKCFVLIPLVNERGCMLSYVVLAPTFSFSTWMLLLLIKKCIFVLIGLVGNMDLAKSN